MLYEVITSPLNGLIAPAASPTRTQLLPTSGPMEKDIGSFPPRGSVICESSVRPQWSGAEATIASMRLEVLTSFHRRNNFV